MGGHFLLQGISPIQESNPGLLHCRQILYHLSYKGSQGLNPAGDGGGHTSVDPLEGRGSWSTCPSIPMSGLLLRLLTPLRFLPIGLLALAGTGRAPGDLGEGSPWVPVHLGGVPKG